MDSTGSGTKQPEATKIPLVIGDMVTVLFDRWRKSSRRRRLLVAYLVVLFLGLMVIWIMPNAWEKTWTFHYSPIDVPPIREFQRDLYIELSNAYEFSDTHIQYIMAVVKQYNDEGGEPIVWLFRDELSPVRGRSSTRLQQTKDILLEIVTNEYYSRPELKAQAINKLSGFHQPQLIPLYYELLDRYRNQTIRVAVVQGLYELGERDRVYDAYEELVRDGYPQEIGIHIQNDYGAREMLLRTLNYDHNPYQQAISIAILARLGERETILPTYEKLVKELENGNIHSYELKRNIRHRLEDVEWAMEGK